MNISKYFTLHEAIYLPSWSREATAADGLNDEILSNLTALFAKLDQVREHFNAPIIIHCAYRPEEYNKIVKGAANSPHKYGQAADFHVDGKSCDEVREEILRAGLLDSLDMRMEQLPAGSPWVHLDIRELQPGHSRYFKP